MAKKVKEVIDSKVWESYVPIVKTEGKHGNIYDVYLTSEIEVPRVYNELISTLKLASKKDTINIMINNGGGVIDSGLMIHNAINRTKAKTLARLSGTVASASTLITLACDTLEIEDYTTFMLHNYFHGTQGTGAQVKEYVNFTDKLLSNTIGTIYKDFLSQKEINSIINQDKEIWLTTSDVEARWKNMKKTK